MKTVVICCKMLKNELSAIIGKLAYTILSSGSPQNII